MYDFQHPNITLRLSIGHKYNAWYLIFARAYASADSREVSRLDRPRKNCRPNLTRRPRFFFDTKAACGWECGSQSLLDFLLSLDSKDPPLFEVISPYTKSIKRARETEVEVLVPENRLAHFCEGCGTWESVNDNDARWILTRQDRLPGYLCPTCYSQSSSLKKLIISASASFRMLF